MGWQVPQFRVGLGAKLVFALVVTLSALVPLSLHELASSSSRVGTVEAKLDECAGWPPNDRPMPAIVTVLHGNSTIERVALAFPFRGLVGSTTLQLPTGTYRLITSYFARWLEVHVTPGTSSTVTWSPPCLAGIRLNVR